MGSHVGEGERHLNTLADLLRRCELLVLSTNSNHVEEDLIEAIRL